MKVKDTHTLSPRSKPDVAQMIEDMDAGMKNAGAFIDRMEQADETLEAYWDGQNEDGLKHDTDDGVEATPYDGASDQRIRVAEEIMNERVLIQKASMVAGRSNFKPKESGDAKNAALFATLMDHFIGGSMRAEIRDEVDFWLNWKEGYGHSVMYVGWHEERALESRTITSADLLQFAIDAGLNMAGLPSVQQLVQAAEEGTEDPATTQQAAQVVELTEDDLRDMILDPARTKQLVAQIRAFDKDVTTPEALRVARALQAGEDGEYSAPYVHESRPKWEALQPFVDVFYPPSVRNLQKSPWICRVHWMSEADVRDRAIVEKWDVEWTKAVLANPGRKMTFGLEAGSWVMSTASVRWGMLDDTELEEQRMYQMIELYSRRSSTAGAPCIFRTLLHGSVSNGYGVHEMLKHKHGRYPFVATRREKKKRPLTTSRGIPELVKTNQNAIKDQHDARTNRTHMAISPPLITAGRRSGGRIRLGPDMEIPESRAGTLRWFEPPALDLDSIQIVKDERAMLDVFFGRWSNTVPQPLVQLHQQSLVNEFLGDVSELVTMTAQLIQQYVTPEEASRIVGTDYTLDAARSTIQAQWDLTITFDVRDLDLEWLAKKMKMMNESVLAGDTLGVVDRAGWTEFMFSAIDPVMAQRLIVPRDKAEKSEIEDEDRALAIIFTGGEPELLQGQNHAARAQRMQEATQTSPTRMQVLQTNGQIKAVWDNRFQFHQTQLSQERNKQIGRLGGSPVLGEALSEAGKIPA